MISKIINWCIKHNYNYTVQECINNNQRITLTLKDYNVYNAVFDNVKKLKNTHIETKTFFSGEFDGCIYIYDIDGYNDIVNYNNNKLKLHEVFWYAKHDGYSSEEAKSKQYQYAVDHDLIDIYNKIYT